MVQIYAGLREQELREAAAQYVSEFVMHRVFPEIASVLRSCARQGSSSGQSAPRIAGW